MPNDIINAAHARCIDSLKMGVKGMHKQSQWVKSSLTQVRAMQNRLLKELPSLESAAKVAPRTKTGIEIKRKYLKCRQNLYRCDQAYQMLRKMELELKSSGLAR